MNIELTQKIRETSRKVASAIREFGKQTIRKVAEQAGCSKSAAHRHIQSQKKRNLYPESWFWETEEGQAWLRLLVFGSLRVNQHYQLMRNNLYSLQLNIPAD